MMTVLVLYYSDTVRHEVFIKKRKTYIKFKKTRPQSVEPSHVLKCSRCKEVLLTMSLRLHFHDCRTGSGRYFDPIEHSIPVQNLENVRMRRFFSDPIRSNLCIRFNPSAKQPTFTTIHLQEVKDPSNRCLFDEISQPAKLQKSCV